MSNPGRRAAAKGLRFRLSAMVMVPVLGCANSRDPQRLGVADGGGGERGGGGAAAVLAQTEHRLCDGSDQIRLAFTSRGGGMPNPLSEVLRDLGGGWLFVNGHCQYWTQEVVGPDYDDFWLFRGYLTGVLSAEQEVALMESVGYGDEPRSAAFDAACQGPIPTDGGGWSLWNGRSTQGCSGGFVEPENWLLRAELVASAHRMDGPIRLHVGSQVFIDGVTRYDWPLSTPLEQFVVPSDSLQSFVVSEPADVAALRALRESRLLVSDTFLEYLPMRDARSANNCDSPLPPGSCLLSFRDELPFTDENGKWSPPSPQ